jgi:hypothetical protein
MSGTDFFSLSTRAQGVDENDKKINALWDAIGDVWDPQSNRDGVVSLGVAENVRQHGINIAPRSGADVGSVNSD